MEFRSLFIVIFSQFLLGKIDSTSNEAKDRSIEDTVLYLQNKMAHMEERISLLELSLANSQKGYLEDRKEIFKKVAEEEMRSTNISSRLQDAENRFLKMDTRLSLEQRAREKSSEAFERVEQETDILQVKMNKTQEMLNSLAASQRNIENVIEKNVSSSTTEEQSHLNDSLSSRFESLAMKMGIFENSLLENKKDYANISFVSELDKSLQDTEKAIRSDIQSIKSQWWMELEERCGLCDGVAELKSTLKNHSSQIAELIDIHNCDDEPPSIRNGKTRPFERKLGSSVEYECNRNYYLAGKSTVRCKRGRWEGEPPVCNFFDATFYLRTVTIWDVYYCFSTVSNQQIEFSRALDTGSGQRLPRGFRNTPRENHVYIEFSVGSTLLGGPFGAFQCGYSDNQGSMKVVVHRQDVSSDLYFPDPFKVSNIGDTVELEVHFKEGNSVRWRHNGADVPSWNNRRKVIFSSVHPTDAGTYECYYEGRRGRIASALLMLNVRKCKKNLFGEDCDQQCPPCYNGGICHDLHGVCICPPGFIGDNCERACESHRHGGNCSFACGYYACENSLFCLPHPYGCACARGWKGLRCNEPCAPGWYGSDCKQACHCAVGPEDCNRFSGKCYGGCSSGWTGSSCQIEELS